MFIDYARIFVRGGKGGDGAVAWRREKFEPSGGPFGGDGGDGGNIILKTDENVRTLMDFRYKTSYRGNNGENGGTKKQFGKTGEDIILKVPVGTLVKDEYTGGVIVDLNENNQEFVIAKGGKGGKGNARFATSTRQAPKFAEPGTLGEERNIILELKLLADIGLVGYPNVGKSTILSILSAARPKIANYHFTTLKPNLGVVKVDVGESYVIADIPGLIDGAHEGVGLGHDFLRHIERTKVIGHVIDMSGYEGRNPIEDYKSIREELILYNVKIEEKPEIIIANKMDIPGAEENLKEFKTEFPEKDIIPISAATKKGLKDLKYKFWDLLKDIDYEYETYDEPHVEIEEVEEPIVVEKSEDMYIVRGSFIDKLLDRTDFNSTDSLRHFQKVLNDQGVIEELKELGIEEEDTVVIGEYEFEFFE